MILSNEVAVCYIVWWTMCQYEYKTDDDSDLKHNDTNIGAESVHLLSLS